MIIYVYILCGFLMLHWVLAPLLKAGSFCSPDDELFHERTTILFQALSNLENGEKKVAEDDRENIRNRLILELAKIYRARGISPQQLLGEPAASEEKTARKTAAKADPFCSGCGKPRENRFQFCPFCGNNFKAA